jgi:type IV pilus assembly protein PilQ
MIEARIVEAADTFSRNLGFRLGVNDKSAGNSLPGGINIMPGANLNSTAFNSGAVQSGSGQISTPIPTLNDFTNVNLPAQNINGVAPGVFSVILFNNAATRFLNMEISALQADGKGKIISSPRVITADQVEAIIEQGTQIPYQQATASGATSISFKNATLSLKVKPQITPDDNIIMSLNVHKDSVGTTTTAGPSIDTKNIATEVLVQNGGTVVIGGIYTETGQSTVSKVPMFGDLPFIGFMFRNTAIVDNKNELLIFISPRIIKDTVSIH